VISKTKSRIGVALDSDLLERFDDFISRLGYTNRSEAFRDLIRDRLVTERTSNPNATVVVTVTLIYDHHAHGVTEKLTELQHANHEMVVSTSYAHLDHHSCLEVLIVHGKSGQVEEFAGPPDRTEGRAAQPSRNDGCTARIGESSPQEREASNSQTLMPVVDSGKDPIVEAGYTNVAFVILVVACCILATPVSSSSGGTSTAT
jgi:CopG family nickel-responsive transcriptional regulator